MSDLASTIGLLRAAFPRQDFPPVSVQVYARALKDLDETLVSTAVVRLCQREDWLPSIAKIRREVAEIALRLPTATEAWLQVQTPVGRAGATPPVKAAVEAIGGPYALKVSAADDIERRFRKAYTELREACIRQFAESPPGSTSLETRVAGAVGPPQATVPGGAPDSAPGLANGGEAPSGAASVRALDHAPAVGAE